MEFLWVVVVLTQSCIDWSPPASWAVTKQHRFFFFLCWARQQSEEGKGMGKEVVPKDYSVLMYLFYPLCYSVH